MPESENTQFSVGEIMKRLMKIEDKFMALEDNISELNDLQLINKLDIINLKSEMDRLNIGMKGPAVAVPSRPVKIAPTPPPPPMPKPAAMKKPSPKNVCKNCGAWVPPNARFCTKCGKVKI